jgi:hypothetical protein
MLSRTRAWLNTGGYVVASLPNVAHGAVRLSMLQGRFQYTDEGLLDETHLRFFTRDTIREMFHQAGFALVETMRTELDIFETEIPLRREDFTPEVLAEIEADPDVKTYQFVTKAVLDNGDAAIGELHEREQAQRAAMFELERQVADGREQTAQLRPSSRRRSAPPRRCRRRSPSCASSWARSPSPWRWRQTPSAITRRIGPRSSGACRFASFVA